MRRPAKNGSISVFAVAGTYVVVLGLDATDRVRKDLLGFAIHRTDNTEKEQYWLLGFRTFKETHPNPPDAVGDQPPGQIRTMNSESPVDTPAKLERLTKDGGLLCSVTLRSPSRS